SNVGRRELSGLTVKRISPIDQNLIFPFWKICECLGHVVPRHSKKYHFTSCSLFLRGNHCSRTESIDYFPQAVWASVIAKLHLVAGPSMLVWRKLVRGLLLQWCRFPSCSPSKLG